MAFPQTAFPGDTRLLKWKKILGAIQNIPGAKSANNPKPGDTRYYTILKVLRAFEHAASSAVMFRVTQAGDQRITQSGDARVVPS